MKDEQRQDARQDAEERADVALDEDLTPDAEQSEQVRGGNDGDVAGSAESGGWGGW
jgi:hypothetical protein